MKLRRILAFGCVLLLCAVAALAVTQGPNNCGKGVSIPNAGLPNWINPNNISASGQSSTVSIPAASGSTELQASTFSFAVPTGATINGIQVSITRKASIVSQLQDFGIFLLKNGLDTGIDHSNNAFWPTTFAAQTYGAVNDLWGSTWSASDINSSSFGVGILVFNNDATTRSASVQAFVTITITYTAPASGLSSAPGIIGTITRQKELVGR